MATNEHVKHTDTRGNIEYPFKIEGVLEFDPPDISNKHIEQSEWKKTVIANIQGDLCEYYYWFIKKRYNIVLNTPLRGDHLTIVNDRATEIIDYERFKGLYDGKPIRIWFNNDVRSDGKHWWLRAKSEDAMQIRQAMGLTPIPFFNFHITIGRADRREHEIEHAEYVYSLIRNYGKEYL